MHAFRSAVFSILGIVVVAESHVLAQGTPAKATVTVATNIVETAKTKGSWLPATTGQEIPLRHFLRTGEDSRALVQFTDLSTFDLNELTTIEILPREAIAAKPSLSLLKGIIYFFSREKPEELEIRTAAVNGVLKGTALVAEARGSVARFTLLEGELELANAHGRITLRSGEQGLAEIGKAPRKTAVIEAVNILQWCLYYPAVLDLRELGLDPAKGGALSPSLEAYRAGALVDALEKYPRGRALGNARERVYRAAVLLAAGQVEKARVILAGVPPREPGRRALEEMIAAVNFTDWKSAGEPRTAGEWLAHSYFLQSRTEVPGALENALRAAKQAVVLAPDFGYAWTRVAELEFSFGRTREALRALDQGLKFTPRNAQAFALKGFLESAQNRIGEARTSFDEAIRLDGALGNAWLGRGLCSIRRGDDEAGRRDLHVAAALEPNRSVLRSYLGKAFSQNDDPRIARDEFEQAKRLDPNDPTPWLYSAIQNKQENRYNEAIRDLEKSQELNQNRRVYRSRFLLDQDLAVRGANLAAIYQNDGLIEQSVREATRAVNTDYLSAPAHLFLANSYNALRDPTRILLRYETPWFNELLLSHLLSPVGGGPLSQFVSQQEYSKLFEADRIGLSTITEYFSNGELREVASQYGTFGNVSYALDVEYQYNDGLRPNNRISRFESYQSFKLQLGPQDTVFLQTKFQDLETGEIFQHYDNREVDRNVSALTRDFRELQDPAFILAGWHHEWSPESHTLVVAGRLANDQVLTARETSQQLVERDIGALVAAGESLDDLNAFAGRGRITQYGSYPLDFDYRANFEIHTGELQHLVTLGGHTLLLGGRYQKGSFTTQDRLTFINTGEPDFIQSLLSDPPSDQNLSVDFERDSLYAYDIWRPVPWLTLTGGVAFDRLHYPENYRSPPLSARDVALNHISPKAGLIFQPTASTTLRAAYTEAISGASFEESIRLEPTQVAGFLQASRTLISESLVGSVAGSVYRFYGLSLEQKLPTHTYLGVQFDTRLEDVDRVVGAIDIFNVNGFFTPGSVTSGLDNKLIYREDAFAATANQLLGDCWAVGARYRFTRAKLRSITSQLPLELVAGADSTKGSLLHEVDLHVLYNHPAGFFGKAEAQWFNQENESGVPRDLRSTPFDERQPGDSFWQFNLYAGYRFHRNQCEISCALLNSTDEDYHLASLTPYSELPRDRTVLLRVKLSF